MRLLLARVRMSRTNCLPRIPGSAAMNVSCNSSAFANAGYGRDGFETVVAQDASRASGIRNISRRIMRRNDTRSAKKKAAQKLGGNLSRGCFGLVANRI